MHLRAEFTYMGMLKNALFILMVFSAVSCAKDEPAPIADHQRYYPLQTGMWRIYDVDSIQYWGSTDYPSDTAKFQVKEAITSTYIDNAGETVYKIETSHRNNENAPWELKYVSGATLKRQQAELWMDNRRYVKLIFPVNNGQSWDANAYNNEDPDRFLNSKYITGHSGADINNMHFDSAIVVEVQNYKDFIQEEFETEQYATGVGLIKHNWTELNTQDDKDNPGKKLIRGFIYTKTLNSYGK